MVVRNALKLKPGAPVELATMEVVPPKAKVQKASKGIKKSDIMAPSPTGVKRGRKRLKTSVMTTTAALIGEKASVLNAAAHEAEASYNPNDSQDDFELGSMDDAQQGQLLRKLDATARMTDEELEDDAHVGENILSLSSQVENPNDIMEARLVLAYRYYIRRLPVPEICQRLEISRSQWDRLHKLLKDRVKQEFLGLDPAFTIGDSIFLYKEVRAMSLQLTTKTGVDDRTKMAAMALALKAENDKNLFLEKIGFFKPELLEPVVSKIMTKRIEELSLTEKKENVQGMVSELIEELAQHRASAEIMPVFGCKTYDEFGNRMYGQEEELDSPDDLQP